MTGIIIDIGVEITDPGYPDAAQFISPLPVDGLQEIFRAGYGVTTESGPVSIWDGFSGGVATQGVALSRPVQGADSIDAGLPGVAFDGVNDFLVSDVVPDSDAGYLVVAFKTDGDGLPASSTLFGSEDDAVNRLRLGNSNISGFRRVAGAIGDQAFSDLIGSTDLVADAAYVAGIYWNSGLASLRLNGTEEDSASYAGTVGTRGLGLGGNATGSGGSNFADVIGAIFASYSGPLTSDELYAIDVAAGVAVGLSL